MHKYRGLSLKHYFDDIARKHRVAIERYNDALEIDCIAVADDTAHAKEWIDRHLPDISKAA